MVFSVYGRIMPNCWLSSRVSIAASSLCFTIPRIEWWLRVVSQNSLEKVSPSRGHFGSKLLLLKGVCLLVITTSGSGQSTQVETSISLPLLKLEVAMTK